MSRLIDFLAELGPRWGLPAEPCRVHGYLYLRACPVSTKELGAALRIDDAALAASLGWLKDYRLVESMSGEAWQTEADPWELVMRALDERRRREAGPALELLRECRSLAANAPRRDPLLYGQIGKLLALVEDLAALDAQAQRLSPAALRQIIGIGARASRFLDRAFGRNSQR